MFLLKSCQLSHELLSNRFITATPPCIKPHIIIKNIAILDNPNWLANWKTYYIAYIFVAKQSLILNLGLLL